MSDSEAVGLVLAAGAGRRMGRPKALLPDRDGTAFVVRAVRELRRGGCGTVTVVVGAAAGEVTSLLAGVEARVVVADDWREGMGASLRAGLRDAAAGAGRCVVVTLVDLPDVGADVVRRLRERLPSGDAALGRATYSGLPGHPVLIGRAHWAPILAAAQGDRGARDYLAAGWPVLVECGDLATGRDVDSLDDLRAGLPPG